MVQHNADLVIAGTTKGTSRDCNCNYTELDLEYLTERRWSRNIFFLLKVINGLLSVYLQ